jgi:lipopolysaccharide biosynthesis glycosyltransferase
LIDCEPYYKTSFNRKRSKALVDVISEYDSGRERFTLKAGVNDSKICPGCRQRNLILQLPNLDQQASRPPAPTSYSSTTSHKTSPARYAFSAAIWSPDGGTEKDLQMYIADAIHVGHQLRSLVPQRDIERILLTEKSARHCPGFRLLELLWKVQPVEDVQVDASLTDACQRRFSKVFTKIRHWFLADFQIVVALDLDLLIRREDVKDLFGQRTPAALHRGNRTTIPGDQRPAETLFNRATGRPQGGINAGVMVIQPDKTEGERMLTILRTPKHPQLLQHSHAPEQDFLSMQFGDSWTSLPVRFNWQPHQIRFCFEGRPVSPDTGCERTELKYEDICIVHFSAKEKPRNFLFEEGKRSKKEFKEWLICCYLKGTITKVDEKQRFNIGKFIDEWFDKWDTAWHALLRDVAHSNKRCPACKSQLPGYSEPLHCFFTCPAIQTLAQDFVKKCHQKALKQFNPGLPMAALCNQSAFPWALLHVDAVHKRRSQEPPRTFSDDSNNILAKLNNKADSIRLQLKAMQQGRPPLLSDFRPNRTHTYTVAIGAGKRKSTDASQSTHTTAGHLSAVRGDSAQVKNSRPP